MTYTSNIIDYSCNIGNIDDYKCQFTSHYNTPITILILPIDLLIFLSIYSLIYWFIDSSTYYFTMSFIQSHFVLLFFFVTYSSPMYSIHLSAYGEMYHKTQGTREILEYSRLIQKSYWFTHLFIYIFIDLSLNSLLY